MELVDEALDDTRVVLIAGARQSGKSTLAHIIGAGREPVWLNLDRESDRAAALSDPETLVTREAMVVIDEVQRVPELLLAIKHAVDRDPRPGRFLLTGSARVLGLRRVADALPGRIEVIELWPFSQGEIDARQDGFVDFVFAHGGRARYTSDLRRQDYVERLVRGGFPEALTRSPRRRERFFDSYVDLLLQRDVMELSVIQRMDEMRRLLRVLAARSGQLLRPADVASDLGVAQNTVRRHLSLLEEVYLIRRIPAWSTNLASRATSTPKVAFVDSGIAANLLDQGAQKLGQSSALGGLLESFVAMELARQATWARQRVGLFHYRTRDGMEVDIVLENRAGEIVAIEVKAASSVTGKDFSGLRHLERKLGSRFTAGIVLYTGADVVPFGPNLAAMPISAVWDLG